MMTAMMTVMTTVAAVALGPVAGAQFPPMPGGPARFSDFHEDLKRRDVAVVFGTLSSLKEGKKERMKPEDGGLGEGGAQVVISGVVFYKIRATGKIETAEAHCGPATAGEKIPVAIDMQSATLPSGEKRRHLLSEGGRVELQEEETVALFVVEKTPGKPGVIRRATRFDVKTPEDRAKAKDQAADWYAINRAKLDLLMAIDEATTLRDRGDKPGAAAKLRAALDAKRTWRRLESDSDAAQALSPARTRATELLTELEKS